METEVTGHLINKSGNIAISLCKSNNGSGSYFFKRIIMVVYMLTCAFQARSPVQAITPESMKSHSPTPQASLWHWQVEAVSEEVQRASKCSLFITNKEKMRNKSDMWKVYDLPGWQSNARHSITAFVLIAGPWLLWWQPVFRLEAGNVKPINRQEELELPALGSHFLFPHQNWCVFLCDVHYSFTAVLPPLKWSSQCTAVSSILTEINKAKGKRN